MTNYHELYTRYAGDVYRFALFLCGDTEQAEEITAETFARAITGRTPLVTSSVKGYLLTIARNLHVDTIRHHKRLTELTPELPDTRPQLDHIVIQKTELEALQVYLQTFPEVDRSALLLRVDGLPYEEIAEMLNISQASAKVKVHRLRLKLAEWRANREQPET